ncbi:MAG: o-succinylbenzoate synthase [Coriobacteriia bacterium]|nr:o-succinylbenzoate synthase [Coriobacteriia bacterium]
MIRAFEETVRHSGDAVFFRFTESEEGDAPRKREHAITYGQTRVAAMALMRQMAREGVKRGDYVASDMDNCPAFIYLILACWYGGFRLITLNHRLKEDEKDERLSTIEDASGIAPVLLTEGDIHEMIALGHKVETPRELVHNAQRAAALTHQPDQSLIMFTSGTTGRAKAAQLSEANLVGSARAFNSMLGAGVRTLWQLCLPLYHIGGFQILVRSILNGTPFLLYRRFEAPKIMADAQKFHATHISVVDKTLRDLMEWSDKGVHGGADTLRAYKCMLLGGAAPNPKTIAAAQELGLPVVSSYGMTETSSLVAFCPIDENDGKMLFLLPGYDACVVDPDDYGRGQLGIRGPGVFRGYAGAKHAATGDGYFITGDTATVQGRSITIEERTDDMFVSGGENVYPEEIRRKLLEIPGVTDAYVYGAEDATWGRRPVAMVEMADSDVGPANALKLSREVHAQAREKLARIYQPDRLFVVDAFPRHGIGKIDRAKLKEQAECYLDVKSVVVHHISQPFVHPVRTAKAELTERESIIVEVVDASGEIGIGEDVAFSTDWYLPETIADDLEFLKKHAIGRVLQDMYLHPQEAYASLATCPGAEDHRMAIAALETALWDLYGKRAKKTMAELIGAKKQWAGWRDAEPCPPGMAPGGAVIGLVPVEEAVRMAEEAVEQGYRRIKLKIAPGDDFKRAHAVRTAVPDAAIILDANQSYTEVDLSILRRLDSLGCAGIEEPLVRDYEPKAKIDIFKRLSTLQYQMKTTLFLDESIITDEDMRLALTTRYLRGYVLKIGKFGGILPALQFYRAARAREAEVWMGGMFDTGISKRLHAAFGLLPDVHLPGDINDTARYFATDITTPPLQLEDGNLLLNPPEAPYGLGCELNREALASVSIDSSEYEWSGRRVIQRA